MKKNKKIKLFLTSLLLFFITTPLVFAEEKEWSLEIDWPAAPNSGNTLTTDSGIAELVAYFYEWGILIGIIIFFGVLIYAGFKYLTSAGNPSKLSDAKKRIISGVSGVILLLGSYLILNTINPELTNIRKVSPYIENVGSHEFSGSMKNDQNLCEFAFTTIQESENNPEETYFLVPGLAQKTTEVLPIKSRACIAEKEENLIREVRENDVEKYWMLVKKTSGEEVENGEDLRVPFGEEDKLSDLYKERYEKVEDTITLDKDGGVYKALRDSRDKNNYNLFSSGICEEDIIGNKNFNRPRCLELDSDGNLTEWKKIGYASLIKAFKAIKGADGFSDPSLDECPSAVEMGTELGYERDTTGGGCSIAFYDGEETNWFSENTVTCSEQISRPSADMNTFDGLVDRETNCMELTRYEKPLNIKTEEYRNKITLSNEEIANAGEVAVCRGYIENCVPHESYRSCGEKFSDNKCTKISYFLPEDKYTVQGTAFNTNVKFKNYTDGDEGCETLERPYGTDGMICRIELDSDKEFILEEK